MTEYAKVTVTFHDGSPFLNLFEKVEEIFYRDNQGVIEFITPGGLWYRSNAQGSLEKLQTLDENGPHSKRVGEAVTKKEVEEWLKTQG